VRQREGGWEIATDHVSSEPWPFYDDKDEREQLAAVCTAGYENQRSIDAAAYLIERADRHCRAVGATLRVLTVPRRAQIDAARTDELRSRSPDPDSFDAGLPDSQLAERCSALQVPFVALAEHLTPSDYQERDIHWTPSGHAKVGALIGALVGT
jgi:hypothetical protein